MSFRPAMLSYNDLRSLAEDAFLTSDLQRIYVDQFVMEHRRRRYRFKSVRDWERVQNSLTEDDYAWFEFQANSFAGLVLVPEAELRERFQAGIAAARKVGMTNSSMYPRRLLKNGWTRTGSGHFLTRPRSHDG